MLKKGVYYCDICKGKPNIAHTKCYRCGADICKEHGLPVRNMKKKRWIGYICSKCQKKK